MGLIAEFTIDTPILREVMREVPDMRIQNPAIYPETDGRYGAMIWAWGDDFQVFEEVLDQNEFVKDYSILSQVGERRLYFVSHADGAENHLAYQIAWENDVLVFDVAGTKEGFHIRALFSGKDSLSNYRESCHARDIQFRLRALYREEEFSDGNKEHSQALTETQRETLLTALELGYFDVPREATLDDIADRLGVSTQAVSTRLRRAQRRLIQASL